MFLLILAFIIVRKLVSLHRVSTPKFILRTFEIGAGCVAHYIDSGTLGVVFKVSVIIIEGKVIKHCGVNLS